MTHLKISGAGDNLSLWKGGNYIGQISEEEVQKHELWIIWRSSQVEIRISKLLHQTV